MRLVKMVFSFQYRIASLKPFQPKMDMKDFAAKLKVRSILNCQLFSTFTPILNATHEICSCNRILLDTHCVWLLPVLVIRELEMASGLMGLQSWDLWWLSIQA